jgi:Flp pilus assembly protein TadG
MKMRLLRRTDGTAAVEAAIFLPLIMLLTFGITDLGSAMFLRQQANAAAQAGATYAVINSSTGGTCFTMSAGCLSGIQTAMNNAAGSSSFCTGTVCTASIAGCTDGAPKCITVSVNYPLTPILPSTAYTWAASSTVSYIVVVRIA